LSAAKERLVLAGRVNYEGRLWRHSSLPHSMNCIIGWC